LFGNFQAGVGLFWGVNAFGSEYALCSASTNCTKADNPYSADGFKACAGWNNPVTVWRQSGTTSATGGSSGSTSGTGGSAGTGGSTGNMTGPPAPPLPPPGTTGGLGRGFRDMDLW